MDLLCLVDVVCKFCLLLSEKDFQLISQMYLISLRFYINLEKNC